MSLKKAMASPLNTLQKSKAIIKRKSRKKIKNRRSKILDDDMQDINIIQTSGINMIPATMHGVFEIREASEVSQSSSEGPKLIIKKRYSWWRRFLNALKHRNWLNFRISQWRNHWSEIFGSYIKFKTLFEWELLKFF